MTPIDAVQVERARRVLDRVSPTWLGRPGVTGIDIGLRERSGELVDEIAIRVFVRSEQRRGERPDKDAFPDEEDGVPIDVIVVGAGAPRIA